MSLDQTLKGLSLKVGPLGESDRLLTLLSDKEGITRLAIPGARKPKSSLSSATPFNLFELQISGNKGLRRVRQLKLIKSFSKVGQHLETLAAAQALAELSLLLVAGNDPLPGMLSTVLIHLERLQNTKGKKGQREIFTLAQSVQSCIHLLALGGYGLPIQECCHSGLALNPPIGEWDWRCSLIPNEGFVIGTQSNLELQLNPSELALLQRLIRPNLPISKDGNLMGPLYVWLKLLGIVECWINHHLSKSVRALVMLRESFPEFQSF